MSLVLRGDLRVRSEASTRKDARMARQTLTPLLCSDLPLGDRWVCGGVMARAVCSPRFLRQLATDCAWHGASRSLAWPGESNPREGHPGIRVLLRETALSPVPLRGAVYKVRRGPLSLSAWASCVALTPASMQSSPHPCGSSPSETPALGLLTGTAAHTQLRRLTRNRAATTGFSKSAFAKTHGLADWPEGRAKRVK